MFLYFGCVFCFMFMTSADVFRRVFRVFSICWVLVFCFCGVFGVEVLVDNFENVSVFEVDVSRVSVEAKGSVVITNPSVSSDLFEFVFLFRDDLVFDVAGVGGGGG